MGECCLKWCFIRNLFPPFSLKVRLSPAIDNRLWLCMDIGESDLQHTDATRANAMVDQALEKMGLPCF